MVIIRLPDGTEWLRANWMFRQLAEDVVEASPGDAEVRFSMEEAEALGALFLDSMEQDRASRILQVIRSVGERTLAGELRGWIGTRPIDKDGQRMYLEAMSELLDAIGRTSDEGAARLQHLPPP